MGELGLVVVLAVFSLLIPVAMLIGSALMRRSPNANLVKNENYESAEQPEGHEVEVMNEYIYYFPIFLALELVSVIILVWASASHYMQNGPSTIILYFLVASFVFSIAGIALARRREKHEL